MGKVQRSNMRGAGFGRRGGGCVMVGIGRVAVRAIDDRRGGSVTEEAMATRGCRKEARVSKP